MSKRERIKLVDVETSEVVCEGDLTPAAVKRMIKMYAQFGYHLKAVA